jgi:hypothetical protein
VDGIGKRVIAARGRVNEEVMKTVREDLHVRCPGSKGLKGCIERMVDAAECRDE